jgi:hypothetical protein
MVEQVLQGRRNAVIIFAADDQKPVGAAVQLRELLKLVWRLPSWMLLVHPIEERELQFERIDEVHLVPTAFEFLDDQPRCPVAHSITPDGAEQDGDRSLGVG